MLDWLKRANCRGMDPHLFFYAQKDYEHIRPPFEVQLACKHCRVRDECYVYALRHEEFGYWAGTTPPERRRLRKAAGISLQRLEQPVVLQTAHGTDEGFRRHTRLHEQPCVPCLDAHGRMMTVTRPSRAQGENREREVVR